MVAPLKRDPNDLELINNKPRAIGTGPLSAPRGPPVGEILEASVAPRRAPGGAPRRPTGPSADLAGIV